MCFLLICLLYCVLLLVILSIFLIGFFLITHLLCLGYFSNFKSIENSDIILVEKLLTSYLGWDLGTENMLNRINFYPPNCHNDICIINRWYNWQTEKEYERTPLNSPSHIIPDVLVYRYDSDLKECKLVIAPRLKKLWYK